VCAHGRMLSHYRANSYVCRYARAELKARRDRTPLRRYLALFGTWALEPEVQREIDRLRLPYRMMLSEQGLAVIHAPVAQLRLETVTSVHALHPGNTECPQCKGSGEVPQHGCGGKGGSRRRRDGSDRV
jgi:hypothetical protein